MNAKVTWKRIGMALFALFLALALNGGAALAAPPVDDGVDWDGVCTAVKLTTAQCSALKKAVNAKPSSSKSTDTAKTASGGAWRDLKNVDGVKVSGGKACVTSEKVAAILNANYDEAESEVGTAINDLNKVYDTATQRGARIGRDWSKTAKANYPVTLKNDGPAKQSVFWTDLLGGIDLADKSDLTPLLVQGTWGIYLLSGDGDIGSPGRMAHLCEAFDESLLNYTLTDKTE